MEVWRGKNSFQVVLINSWIVLLVSLNNALQFHAHIIKQPPTPSHNYYTGDHGPANNVANPGAGVAATSLSSSSHNHQADQPVHNSSNYSSTGNNNNSSSHSTTPPPPPPPPPSNNQPYRHQENLKDLSKNISHILDSFSANYDKRVRPNHGGEAVEVGITLFVLSVSTLSEVEMDFTVDFYFRQKWKDHRLTFQGPPGVNTLNVNSEFLRAMWVPDTFFVNEKFSYFHTATTANELVRISQTGEILRSMRLTVCASCPMDLRHFPMDSQLCTIEIESFGYSMSDVRYKWAAGPGSVGMASDVSLSQFKVFGYRQKTYEVALSSGNYSRLACEIQFVRSMGYYLIQIYFPSSIIVVISWVSFWLSRAAVPARVYLGITTVLTMTTLMSSTNKALPKISYVKSIDMYLGTCFVMVFAALLEYATVCYLEKHIQMRKNDFDALYKFALQLQAAQEEQHSPATTGPSSGPPPLPQQQQPQPVLDADLGGGGMLHPEQVHPPLGGIGIRNTQKYHFQQPQQQHPQISQVRGGGGASSIEEQRDGGDSAGSTTGPGTTADDKIRQLIIINPNQICGITPSDIDKYSRVVFPGCFACFNLMYWIIYLHISNVNPTADLVIH